MTQPLPGPDVAELDLVTVLDALADPVRLAYVRALAGQRDRTRCGEVLRDSAVRITKSTLSHHLHVLRRAGVTETRVEGTGRYVTLRRADLDARFPGLLDAVCRPAR